MYPTMSPFQAIRPASVSDAGNRGAGGGGPVDPPLIAMGSQDVSYGS